MSCLALAKKNFHSKLACKCMYVRIRKPNSVKKKSFLLYLNISSPCSQHSGVPDFLITVFQSTSYEFVLVQHVSNPMVSGHRSYLMVSPLVFNRKSAENKRNLPTRQTVGSLHATPSVISFRNLLSP